MAKAKGNGTSSDLTVQILREIRDEIRSTNRRLDDTRADLSGRMEETNRTLGETRADLSARIDETNKRLGESEVRLATAILDLRTSLVEVRDLLKDQLELRHRVERIEQHLGLPPGRAA